MRVQLRDAIASRHVAVATNANLNTARARNASNMTSEELMLLLPITRYSLLLQSNTIVRPLGLFREETACYVWFCYNRVLDFVSIIAYRTIQSLSISSGGEDFYFYDLNQVFNYARCTTEF